ncbi:MAG: competence/damage-inducible protein A [Clostridia bacterium]|nr:competence/damage-inducible protein A [Clostridia bacterium]
MSRSCELIAVGTELLLGEIVNTDSAFIASRLAGIGVDVYYQTVVGDNPARLAGALAEAAERADVIVTTGGLGPTYDDLTKETICRVFGKKLVRDEESLAHIRDFFRRIGREMTPNNEKQADLPEGATVFKNHWGTAPGCAFRSGKNTVVMLPGPPSECEPMTEEYVIPYLADPGDGVLTSRFIRIWDVGESAAEAKLRDMMIEGKNPTVAPYAKAGSVQIRVAAKAPTREEGFALCEPAVRKILATFGKNAYEETGLGLPEHVFALLKAKGMTLSAAESCTGGLISKMMTDLPGVSEVFMGGVCTYSNEAKSALLGVDPALIREKGAVSEEVAREMAERVRTRFGTDLGVGVTGIAGPGGGSAEKPVGLVYVALSDGKKTEVRECRFGTLRRTRERIRTDAANTALDMARRRLLEE